MKNTFYSYAFILVFLMCGAFISCKSDAESTNTEEISFNQTPGDFQEEAETEEIDFEFPKLLPIDESNQSESLQTTIKALKEAVKSKKVRNILPFFSEDVQVSFGDESGHEGLKSYWELNSTEAKNSEIWQVLSNTLELGGTFSDANSFFTIPYIFTHYPEKYDPYEYLVIIGENVRMRDQPSLNGQVLATMSHELVLDAQDNQEVKEKIGNETHIWEKVVRQNQETGYVYGKYARSILDYRIGFAKKGEEWLIQFFVAGD